MKGLVALALLLICACGSRVKQDAAEPQSETTVKVDNQNFLDMDVYVIVENGPRIRLGTVPSITTQTFVIPANLVRGTARLRFEFDPIGGAGLRNQRSELILVQPGDQVVLMIPPS